MTPADRAIVAAAEERDRQWGAETPGGPPLSSAERGLLLFEAGYDRRVLLRIVRAQDALLRERDTQAEDLADDAAAARATAGKWGA